MGIFFKALLIATFLDGRQISSYSLFFLSFFFFLVLIFIFVLHLMTS